MSEALGIIETRGKVALVTAVDTALKAASVRLLAEKLVGGGLVNATVTGDVGSVKAAMSAAEGAIRSLSASGQTWVIARPAPQVWGVLEEKKRSLVVRPAPPAPALRREPEAPALRQEASLPAVRPEAGLPAAVEPPKEPKAPKKKPRKPGGKK